MRSTHPSLITNMDAHHHSVSRRTSPMSDHRVLTGSAVSETSPHPPISDSQSVLPRGHYHERRAARADARRPQRTRTDRWLRREAESFFTTLDQATTGCNPQEAAIEAFPLGVRLVHDSPLYSRIVESEPELFGLFSRSRVFPIGRFADGIAHTLRRCGADIPEPDQCRRHPAAVRLGIIMFPTDRLDTSDPAAVREYAARYLVPIIGKAGH